MSSRFLLLGELARHIQQGGDTHLFEFDSPAGDGVVTIARLNGKIWVRLPGEQEYAPTTEAWPEPGASSVEVAAAVLQAAAAVEEQTGDVDRFQDLRRKLETPGEADDS
jgi:hypothetical protein